jgi:hypothetical protein
MANLPLSDITPPPSLDFLFGQKKLFVDRFHCRTRLLKGMDYCR